MTVRHGGAFGFANPVDPRPDELRAWAYHSPAGPQATLPTDWDLLVAGDTLAPTLFELAMDRRCPARQFALHCLYIYAADSVRSDAGRRRQRRLTAFVERAEDLGDPVMTVWAYNTRVLRSYPDLLDQELWFEGGLVRHPHRISRLRR
jgi:hypothetical protein